MHSAIESIQESARKTEILVKNMKDGKEGERAAFKIKGKD